MCVGTGTDTFQLGGSAGSATFDLASIGPAQQYRGFSTFNVVGANWTATGTFAQSNPWTVQAGTLNVTGDLSAATSLTVNGGTLMGTGTVGATQINSGGTFAPGSGAPGSSMTVARQSRLRAGRDLPGAGQSDHRVVRRGQRHHHDLRRHGQCGVRARQLSHQAVHHPHLGRRIAGTFAGLANTNLPAGFTESLSYTRR